MHGDRGAAGRPRVPHAAVAVAAAVAAVVVMTVAAAAAAAGGGSGRGLLALQINADTRSLPPTAARVARPAETTEQFYASQHPVYIRW